MLTFYQLISSFNTHPAAEKNFPSWFPRVLMKASSKRWTRQEKQSSFALRSWSTTTTPLIVSRLLMVDAMARTVMHTSAVQPLAFSKLLLTIFHRPPLHSLSFNLGDEILFRLRGSAYTSFILHLCSCSLILSLESAVRRRPEGRVLPFGR